MNILGFLTKYGIDIDPKGVGSRPWIGVRCPFCGDTGYHGGFNLNSGGWACFLCKTGKKKGIRGVIKTLTGVSWSEVSEIIKIYFGGFGTGFIPKELEGNISFQVPGVLDLNPIARNYLLNRCFDPDFLQKEYGLRWGGYSGDYAYRVIVPIRYQGKEVSFLGRDVTGSDFRYKDCRPEEALLYHKKILFNLDNCQENWVIVVEGTFDSMRGGKGFAATCGTGYTPAQVFLLSDLFDRVGIWFDNSPRARKSAKALCSDLNLLGTETKLIQGGSGEDPATCQESEIEELKYMFKKGCGIT